MKISLLAYRKTRKINSKYFFKKRKLISLTINLDNGNLLFYSNDSADRKNRNKGKIRVNAFHNLIGKHSELLIFDYIEQYFGFEGVSFRKIENFDEVSSELKKIFNDKEIEKIIRDKFFENGYIDNKILSLENTIINYFAFKQGIKMPDNLNYIKNYYPGIRSLRKNNMNLIQTIMVSLDINSKYTKKLLNKQNVMLSGLKKFSSFFGDEYGKYLSNIIHEDFFVSRTDREDPHFLREMVNYEFKYKLSKIEKENIIKIINDNEGYKNVHDVTQIFLDHFDMLERCKKYYPDLSLTATKNKTFKEDHYELSEILSKLRKKYSLSYVYNERTLHELESPILCMKNDEELHTLYPFILKRDEDYEEEGSIMKHCVSSYSNKEKSMIISLRNEDNTDRITIEYDISTEIRKQARHIWNANPPKIYEDGILLLDLKVKELARLGLLNWTEKIKVPIKINGVEVLDEDIETSSLVYVHDGDLLPF